MRSNIKSNDRRSRGMEDKILDQMISEQSGMGWNTFSDVTQDTGRRIGQGGSYDPMFPDERKGQDNTEFTRFQQSMPAYNEFRESYVNRDQDKYGRLSFEDYVPGLTPEEGYISSLGSDQPSEVASAWTDVFGEDTELMKQAAFDYGRTFDRGNYPEAKNTYNQGQ